MFERFTERARQVVVLAQQPEEDVFRADVVVLEDARLLLCEDNYLPGALCESLEQLGFLTLEVVAGLTPNLLSPIGFGGRVDEQTEVPWPSSGYQWAPNPTQRVR